MIKEYKAWFGEFKLDPALDFYGDAYWKRVADKTYEPDTQVFLENNIDKNVDFVDVGAATGAMSIVAASLGGRVLAFEAVPRVYRVASINLKSNSHLENQIQLKNQAISSNTGILKLGHGDNPKVLSSISDEDTFANFTEMVEIVSLGEEVERFHKKERKLVIKVDIEGAEWKLFSDTKTLETLYEHSAIVLLAIHPGFYRPFKVLPFGVTFFTKKFWQVQNLIIAYRFFKKVSKYATMQRTSLDKITSPKKCILLMFGGYFEFILTFSNNQ